MNDVQILEAAVKENPNDMAAWGALQDAYLETGSNLATAAKRVIEDQSTLPLYIDKVKDCQYDENAWSDLVKEIKTNYPLFEENEESPRRLNRFWSYVAEIIEATRLKETRLPSTMFCTYVASSARPTNKQQQWIERWIAIHNGERRFRTIEADEILSAVASRITGKKEGIIDLRCNAVANAYGYRAYATGVCGGVIKLRNRRWLVVLFADVVSANGSCSMPLGNRNWPEYKKNLVPEFLARCAC